MEMEDSRERNFHEKFYAGLISQNFYRKFVYVSGFNFNGSILRVEMLIVIARGKFSPGLYCPEISVWRGFFCRNEARYPGVI